jgi:SAM-dependent methyltransferase
MPLTSPPDTGSIRPPHPLALRIIEGPNGPSAGPVLDFGTGSGRNATALRGAGFEVVAIPDGDDGSNLAFRGYAAALSTHALLHGWPDDISQRVRRIAQALVPGGGFYATFGSTDDARFGAGTQLGPQTFAPENGDEAGIAHSYFDEAAVREVLASHFDVTALAQFGVDAIAGTWAHPTAPLQGAIHWFVEAIAR